MTHARRRRRSLEHRRVPRVTRRNALVLVALVLLAVNLRPAAVSVGPVLDEVRDGLGMSASSAGLLTSLPVLAFALFGAMAPGLASRIGVHRVTLLRSAASSWASGRGCWSTRRRRSWPVDARAGRMPVANVVLPSLVKLHFPDRVGLVTAIYTTALSIGLTAALWLTVPISNALGDWRDGLGAWAAIAVIAAIPWLGLVSRDRHLERPEQTIGYAEVLPPLGPGDGPVLRVPVPPGLRDLRLVRDALARLRVLGHRRGPARRAPRRHRDSPVPLGADPAGEVEHPRACCSRSCPATWSGTPACWSPRTRSRSSGRSSSAPAPRRSR